MFETQSFNFNLHPIVLICVTLNPRCPVDLGRSRRQFQSCPIQLRPTKSPSNDGASRADPYAADPYRLSDEEEGLGGKKIRPPRHVLQYEVVKRWVTGERAIIMALCAMSKFELNLKG